MKHNTNAKKNNHMHVKRSVALILAATSCFSLAAMPQTSEIFRDYTITASASSNKYNEDTLVLATNATANAYAYDATWYSQNRRFKLTLNTCGNLSIYDTVERRITWQTNTGIAHNYETDLFTLKMQDDGNLVIYQSHRDSRSASAIWNTKTVTGAKSNGYSLRLSNDGELYIYFADRDQSLFSSRNEISCTDKDNTCLRTSQCLTSPNLDYRAVMQGDGNFVVYHRTGGKDVVVWSTNTPKNNGAFLSLQKDGNLVIYKNVNNTLQSRWSSGTDAKPYAGYKLSLGNDGVLTLTRKNDNKVRWTSARGSFINAAEDAQYRVKSGFEYSSIDEAAKDFILAYNGMSVAQNREYASVINGLDNGKYVFRYVQWGPLRGNSYNGSSGESMGYYDDTVAYVHTHGKILCDENRYFSNADRNLVNGVDKYQYGYLGNANGEVFRYGKRQQQAHGTLLETNRGKYVNTFYDKDITAIQNNGEGIWEKPD